MVDINKLDELEERCWPRADEPLEDVLHYKRCEGVTIGDLIRYLEQFPPAWQISIRTNEDEPDGDRFVLRDCGIQTILTEAGKGLGP